MRILVTGGTGFIGSHLVPTLTSKHTLYILSRKNSDRSRLNNVKKNIHFLSYSSLNDLQGIFSKNSFDVIIHLATFYIKYPTSTEEIQQMSDANITFPSCLLDLAVKHKVKAFINTGTCFEYKLIKRPYKESDLISPYNFYAATKVSFENILKFYVNTTRLKAVTLKLSFPYGEKDQNKLMVLLIDSILKTKSMELTKGEQRLNYTYVSDIVDAYKKALTFLFSKDYKKYESFNIANNKLTSVKTIVKILEYTHGRKSKVSLTKPYAENEIMYMASNCSKAESILKWKPKISITEGLKKMYKYYANNS